MVQIFQGIAVTYVLVHDLKFIKTHRCVIVADRRPRYFVPLRHIFSINSVEIEFIHKLIFIHNLLSWETDLHLLETWAHWQRSLGFRNVKMLNRISSGTSSIFWKIQSWNLKSLTADAIYFILSVYIDLTVPKILANFALGCLLQAVCQGSGQNKMTLIEIVSILLCNIERNTVLDTKS